MGPAHSCIFTLDQRKAKAMKFDKGTGNYTFGFWCGLLACRLNTEPVPDWFLYVLPVIAICFWLGSK